MRTLYLIALIACGPKPVVVSWATASVAVNEQIEIRSNGIVSYTSEPDVKSDRDEQIELSSAQLRDLDELLRSHHACELKHDPEYTPLSDEGKTTLDIAFSDQRCTVELFNAEWQRGEARDIADTMHSMRPRRAKRVR